MSEKTMMEFGWVIENGHAGEKLRYRTIQLGKFVWIADHNKALRFARHEDAMRVADYDGDYVVVTSHGWENSQKIDLTTLVTNVLIEWNALPKETRKSPELKNLYDSIFPLSPFGQS